MNSTDIRDAFGRRIELHESAEVTSMGGLCACVEHLRRRGVLDALHKSLDPTLPGRGQAGKVRYSAARASRAAVAGLDRRPRRSQRF